MGENRLLKSTSSKILVTKYLDYKEYLAAVYLEMKQANEVYSYVQFAIDLGFSSSNVMYLIIKGQRPLTSKTGKKIADALDLKGIERKYWDDLVAYFKADQAPERESLFQDLVLQKSKTLSESDVLSSQLEFFSEWYHGAIYELSFMDGFNEDPRDIANTLVPKIRVDQAKKSIALLEKLGLFIRDEKTNRLRPSQEQITTGHEISSMALVRYHQKMLELAKQALLTIELEEREISATSVTLTFATFSQIKQEIRDFRAKLMKIAVEDKAADRVYQMNFQLFPLSRKKKSS